MTARQTQNPVVIRRYEPADQEGVLELILPIQREEFGVAITAQDQPDLAAIPDFYQSGGGDFWVAEAHGRVVGTIALKDIGAGDGALRKMFVAPAFRGGAGVARGLLEVLMDAARRDAFRTLYLGTTEQFVAAHRFYEKSGFRLIAASDLPETFPRMKVDTRFYAVDLAGAA